MLDMHYSWGLAVVTAFAIALIVWASNHAALRRRKIRQEKGLQWLSNLRELLSNIQKHRGMSNGFLNGGRDLVHDIERLQRNVSRDLSNIASVDAVIEDNSRWQGITQHWARLAGNYQHHDSAYNLSQHNMLIKNLLYLIDDLAQDCDLLLLKNREDKPLHLYWRELLSAAEYIGQARAIGIGVSTAEHCDSVSRIRLNYLCQQIEGNTERLWREIGSDPKQTSCVEKLVNCIHHQLVLDTPSISPSDFFSVATDAIDSLLDQFDRLIKEQQWA